MTVDYAERTKSSARLLREHESDLYLNEARAAGYRSRAVYKLGENQRTDKIARRGTTIVDLGASASGWSHFASRMVRIRGGEPTWIVASNIFAMDAIPDIEFIQGDFLSR